MRPLSGNNSRAPGRSDCESLHVSRSDAVPVLDAREISGHYLIYGSEHICGIAASMVRQVGLDCRQSLKRFGTPTVFRVALPREIIPKSQLRELAGHLREYGWEMRKASTYHDQTLFPCLMHGKFPGTT